MLHESPFTRSVIHCYSSSKSVPVSRSQTLEERYIIKNKKKWPYSAETSIKRGEDKDFPGGPVVKDLPSSAGLTGSIPGQGMKIPRVVGQPNPLAAATREPTCRSCEPARSRTLALQQEKLTTTRESRRTAMKTQCNQNKKERKNPQCSFLGRV